MKVVKFIGGLGNQMFQYAFYLSLKKKFSNVKADLIFFEDYELHYGFELERVFGIRLNLVNPWLAKIVNRKKNGWGIRKLRSILRLKKSFLQDRNEFHFTPEVYAPTSLTYYDGYWQNEDYFCDIADTIRQHFNFKQPLQGKNEEIAKTINTCNSVGVHVRRGDYVNHPVHGNICDKNYYTKAVELIEKNIPNPTYFIFSNDINWCMEHLGIRNAHYINWNTDYNSYIDMQLMSLCKNQIIANSSFSWWAAWLNKNEDKIVVAPSKWLKDNPKASNIILSQWHKI